MNPAVEMKPMAYNEFTLPHLKRQFGLTIQEEKDLFRDAPAVATSDLLRQSLEAGVSLALDIATEKARSEFIIAPILLEVRRQLDNRISLFSGTEFTVDPEQGLRGVCDFLLSLSPLQLAIEAPVVAVVEAKNEDMRRGAFQCIAELVAVQRFNRDQGRCVPTVYGAVTTGNNWRFLRLQDTAVTLDQREYYLYEVERIVGILVSMVREAASHDDGRLEPL
jgi:hypothetical protein